MVVRKSDIPKNSREKSSLDKFVNSSPDEVTTSKDMLTRESFTFRVNRDLWDDFDYWCKKNRVSRSDVLENFLLEKLGKKKEDYRAK